MPFMPQPRFGNHLRIRWLVYPETRHNQIQLAVRYYTITKTFLKCLQSCALHIIWGLVIPTYKMWLLLIYRLQVQTVWSDSGSDALLQHQWFTHTMSKRKDHTAESFVLANKSLLLPTCQILQIQVLWCACPSAKTPIGQGWTNARGLWGLVGPKPDPKLFCIF